MTELNGKWYYVDSLSGGNTLALYLTFKNRTLSNPIDSSGFTTHSGSTGKAVKAFPVNGASWTGDTGNDDPSQYYKHGSDAPTADFPSPGSGDDIFVADLAPLVVIGKTSGIMVISYMVPD